MKGKREIYVSPLKTILLLTGSLVFVVLGLIYLLQPERLVTGRVQSESIIQLVGLLSVVFFGLAFVFGIKQLLTRKPGLIFDSTGISINQGIGFKGTLEWNKIAGYSEVVIKKQPIIMLHLENPESIIQAQKSKFRKMLMQFSLSSFGSPVSITATGMQISYPELLNLVKDYYAEYKRN